MVVSRHGHFKALLQAVNPDNQIKKGQSVSLTCRIMVDKVWKNAITWYKDGKEITKGLSKNK